MATSACSFTISRTAGQLDVFVGVFRMCHAIPLTDRLLVDELTLPLAELLLTKLQIVKLNEKDLRDAVAILHHHDVGEHDGATINATRIAELCAEDWGLWRTSKLTIERVREGLDAYGLASSDLQAIETRLERIWAEIERAPKSRGWRMRDRVGDRKRWYDDPRRSTPEGAGLDVARVGTEWPAVSPRRKRTALRFACDPNVRVGSGNHSSCGSWSWLVGGQLPLQAPEERL